MLVPHATSATVAVLVRSGVLYVVMSDCIVAGQWVTNVQAAASYTYVHGNIVHDVTNGANNQSGALANLYANIAGSYTLIGQVFDNVV